MTKLALLAVSRFRDLAGSEITALEYALELQSQGWDVTIAAFELGDALVQPVRANGIDVLELEPDLELAPVWDLIWVIHPTTYYFLFARLALQARLLVYSCLSHFEPMESPPLLVHPVDLFTVNSEEHLSFFCEQYPDYAHQVVKLPNSAPATYFEHARPAQPQFKRIAVVSNHAPAELKEAGQALRTRGIALELIGIDGTLQRVVPELLAGFDAVISIGKTVQYSLAMALPVFCYDHFGGPGWITSANVAEAAAFNFSGRGSVGRCSAQELEAALLAGPPGGPDDLAALKSYCAQHFDLSRNLATTLEAAKARLPERAAFSSLSLTQARILARYNQVPIRARKLEIELREALADSASRLADIDQNANAQIAYREALVVDLQSHLDEINANANAQIEYRDALLSQLQTRLDDVNANATAQIEYRDALVNELQSRLAAVDENANAQIRYRDDLLAELQSRLDAINANANAQIAHRDNLIAALQSELDAARKRRW